MINPVCAIIKMKMFTGRVVCHMVRGSKVQPKLNRQSAHETRWNWIQYHDIQISEVNHVDWRDALFRARTTLEMFEFCCFSPMPPLLFKDFAISFGIIGSTSALSLDVLLLNGWKQMFLGSLSPFGICEHLLTPKIVKLAAINLGSGMEAALSSALASNMIFMEVFNGVPPIYFGCHGVLTLTHLMLSLKDVMPSAARCVRPNMTARWRRPASAGGVQ